MAKNYLLNPSRHTQAAEKARSTTREDRAMGYLDSSSPTEPKYAAVCCILELDGLLPSLISLAKRLKNQFNTIPNVQSIPILATTR
jgi:hypothetical protein